METGCRKGRGVGPKRIEPTTSNYCLTLSYDGSAYHGWQSQPDKISIQQTLEEAIAEIVQEKVHVTASGRTDAGVHAMGQVANARFATRLDERTLCKAINAKLPLDIRIQSVRIAVMDFNAIRHAQRKRYRYVLQDGDHGNVFARNYCWYLPKRLDLSAMQQAAALIQGEHDFACFQTAGSPRKSTVRTVYAADVRRVSLELWNPIYIEVEANGFLYNMMRNIVGTLVKVGQGREPVDWVRDVIAGRDRRRAGCAAPAKGLYLLYVEYPTNVFLSPAASPYDDSDGCDRLEGQPNENGL